MLDWTRAEVQFRHTPLPSGKVLSISPEGEMEWESPKKIHVRGSYESSIKIRSAGGDGTHTATDLQVDGNLAKFLQGHNVFGIEDQNKLMYLALKKIFANHAELFTDHDSVEMLLARVKKGNYLINMIDINRMYSLNNDESVESWLHAAEMKARSRSGRACRDKGTVYLQKNSRRWAIKFYNKYREMLKHPLPDELLNSGLLAFSIGKLRAELRLHSLQLKDLGITHGYHLNENVIDKLFEEYLGRVDMTTQATLIDEKLLKLPRAVGSTYQLWKQGVSLKDLLPETTFYRHRKMLLEHKIDITIPPAAPDRTNIVPLVRVLEAKPVEIPSWAYENNLIAL